RHARLAQMLSHGQPRLATSDNKRVYLFNCHCRLRHPCFDADLCTSPWRGLGEIGVVADRRRRAGLGDAAERVGIDSVSAGDHEWSRPCYSRPMTTRLSNLPPTRIEKLETFLIERWCLLRLHCEDGTVGTGEAGVHGWPRPTAAMIDEMKSYLVGRDPSTIEHHAQA